MYSFELSFAHDGLSSYRMAFQNHIWGMIHREVAILVDESENLALHVIAHIDFI